jgi:hypothetical protein
MMGAQRTEGIMSFHLLNLVALSTLLSSACGKSQVEPVAPETHVASVPAGENSQEKSISPKPDEPEQKPACEVSDPEVQVVCGIIVELLDICASDDWSPAAQYVLYRGDDETRKWKHICDCEVPEEKKMVDEVCETLRADLDGFDTWQFAVFNRYEEARHDWIGWEMWFYDIDSPEDAPISIRFLEFIKIEDKYYLGKFH